MQVQPTALANGQILSDGPYSGWVHIPGEPFNDRAGPFHHRWQEDGSIEFGFTPGGASANNMGIVHGGCLLTFADYCLFVTAREKADPDEIVTISMSSEFVGMAYPGYPINARTEIVRGGRSLIFIRGLLAGPNGTILSFSGVAKVIAHQKKPALLVEPATAP